MPTKATRTPASRSSLITKSTFSNYDLCINPYVGCEFGCSYCYVRFFVKDPEKDWGEFVRIRDYLEEKLPKELNKGFVRVKVGTRKLFDDHGLPTGETANVYENWPFRDKRLVIGTMTDPYQPAEKTFRITRQLLTLLQTHSNKFNKVGIFTRSPLVLQDLDLIKTLPRARIHFTVTPFPAKVLRAIEPYSSITETRWKTIEAIQNAGIRCHVNISPVMPGMSEQFIEEFVDKLGKLGVAEYFVDPMEPYKESFEAFKNACGTITDELTIPWAKIEQMMLNKPKYLEWKAEYFAKWEEARRKNPGPPEQLPIWSDHENRTWIDMRTGQHMSKRAYGDDITNRQHGSDTTQQTAYDAT